jgi:predicted nucleotidyltransferase
MKIDSRLNNIVAAQPYPLIFATISGAHLYGFPSPDSDYDLRGAHVLPLDAVVGLEVRDETVQQEMIIPPDTSQGRARHSVRAEDGNETGGAQGTDAPYHAGALEMDIVSHDVKKFFGLLLKKNGYVLEQLYSPLIVHSTPEHAELKAICNPRQGDTSPNPPHEPRSSRRKEAPSEFPENDQSLLTSAATVKRVQCAKLHLGEISRSSRRRGRHHQAPLASLLRFLRDAVEIISQRRIGRE